MEVLQTHRVRFGGLDHPGLLAALDQAGIRRNAYADQLLEGGLDLPPVTITVQVVTLTVAALVPQGPATLATLAAAGAARGLRLAPLGLAPFFRLAYRDQPEEWEPGIHRAPRGSITLLSPLPHPDEEDYPKGFYLRVIEGQLWLRGYRCPLDHLWNPEDRVALVAESELKTL